jgi:tetratricopeptide (TPR) repeat protein
MRVGRRKGGSAGVKLLLVVPSFLLTLLLLVHAVRVKGARTALLFFGTAFLFGVVRGNSVAALASGENSGPYIFSDPILSIGRAELPACVGWVFALYLSWWLAERVVRRIPDLAGRVFPTAALGILAMGCFSDAVETTASGTGWWRWNIVRPATPFLPGGTHLFGIVEWMSVGFDYLLPFLLFRGPRGPRSLLAVGSLVLYPIHWVTHWKQATAPGFPHAYEIYHALIALSVLVLPLLREPRFAERADRAAPGWIRGIPAAAILGMFLVLGTADLVAIGDPELLVSLVPLASLLVAALGGNVSLAAGTALGFASVAVLELAAGRTPGVALARAVPALVPAAVVILLSGRAGVTRPGPRRTAYVAATATVAALTGFGLVAGKREREEYSRRMERAVALIGSGNTAQAERELRSAARLKPNLNLAPKYLANLYGGTGRLEEARREAEASVDLDPTDWEAHRIAANVLRAMGRISEAIPGYRRALRLNPTDAESAKGLSQCYFRTGRVAEGAGVLREALRRTPEDPELVHLLAAALVQSREFAEATRLVRGRLERDPEDATARVLLAFIHAETGDFAAARAEAERALRSRPDDPQARQLLESLPR